MKKETATGFLATAAVSAIVVGCSYTIMNLNGRVWGMYGIPALYAGGVELLVGMVLVFPIRTRLYGAGVLMAALLTLLIGNSICSGWIRF